MRITFDPAARVDLDEIFASIAERNEAAANEMIARIEAKIAVLATAGLEHMGRPGLDEGTRELIEYPYLIVYEVFESRRDRCVVCYSWCATSRARKIVTQEVTGLVP
jgi:plasmid stabilization system protein ParE